MKDSTKSLAGFKLTVVKDADLRFFLNGSLPLMLSGQKFTTSANIVVNWLFLEFFFMSVTKIHFYMYITIKNEQLHIMKFQGLWKNINPDTCLCYTFLEGKALYRMIDIHMYLTIHDMMLTFITWPSLTTQIVTGYQKMSNVHFLTMLQVVIQM